MDCLACGTSKTRVVDSTDDGVICKRKRSCRCGAVYWSTEISDRKTLRVPISSNGLAPVATHANGSPSLPTGSNPLAPIGAGGVGGALPSGIGPTGSVPGLIPSLPPDQGAETRAKPPHPEDPKHPRSAHGLLALFGRRWEAHEKKLWLKARFDDRDAVELAEAIGEIPGPDDRANAWEEVIGAVETYLRIDAPFYAGHPFRRFLQDLPALRTGDAAGLDRLRKTKPEWDAAARKHQQASQRTRESEPTPIGAVVPKEWTAEEKAAAAALRQRRKAGGAA